MLPFYILSMASLQQSRHWHNYYSQTRRDLSLTMCTSLSSGTLFGYGLLIASVQLHMIKQRRLRLGNICVTFSTLHQRQVTRWSIIILWRLTSWWCCSQIEQRKTNTKIHLVVLRMACLSNIYQLHFDNNWTSYAGKYLLNLHDSVQQLLITCLQQI